MFTAPDLLRSSPSMRANGQRRAGANTGIGSTKSAGKPSSRARAKGTSKTAVLLNEGMVPAADDSPSVCESELRLNDGPGDGAGRVRAARSRGWKCPLRLLASLWLNEGNSLGVVDTAWRYSIATRIPLRIPMAAGPNPEPYARMTPNSDRIAAMQHASESGHFRTLALQQENREGLIPVTRSPPPCQDIQRSGICAVSSWEHGFGANHEPKLVLRTLPCQWRCQFDFPVHQELLTFPRAPACSLLGRSGARSGLRAHNQGRPHHPRCAPPSLP